MDEIRAELDSLEEDLEAFIRGRVEPALARALEARVEDRARDLAIRVDARLKDFAAQADGAAAVQARELRALTQTLGEVRKELARISDRVARLERRAPPREDGDAIEPSHPPRTVQVYRREAPPPRPGPASDLMQLILSNREYVTIGAVAAAVICLVVWVVFFFVREPTRPAAPAPAPAPVVAAETPQAAAAAVPAPRARRELIHADPVDAGLNELAGRSSAVRALCGGRSPCTFGEIWPGLTDSGRRSLLLAASDLVATRCAGRLPPAAISLAPAWRAAVACSRDTKAPVLYGPRDYEPVARWLLTWIGGHP